ncbi:hypothetical protein [Actinotalea sp. K2]|uniref:hypothetical protein n=1 Tax=Actinotalea sp. K2 TaxID=2939438 RepID=UPI002017A1E2|nr:hypothetical protein [Actinotalea sp. K2]MCL3862939.1 hypothetical protein [Actinotalea sp. K2]
MTNDNAAAASSPEYQRALEAQQDYDSTLEGQRLLTEALASAPEDGRASLVARLHSGKAAARFRREQAALMPPAVRRSEPTAGARRRLATERENLARLLGFAAAETGNFTKPTPRTISRLEETCARVLAADLEAQPDPDPFGHLRWPAPRPTAPWTGERTQPAHPGDVAVLILLGVDASWTGGELLVDGPNESGRAWGYEFTEVKNGGSVVTGAPAIAAWARAH